MDIQRVELQPQTMLGVRDVVPLTGLSIFFGTAFDATAAELARQGVRPAGAPIALYTGNPTDTVDVTAGFPVVDPVETGPSTVVVDLSGGPAVQIVHTGNYDTLADTYAQVIEWLTEQKLTPTSQVWEEYLVGPDSGADPADWQTRIVFPIESP
ncbi:GyrI-like domain-containing protein [Glaciibacter sp. 2TAF33]|uniref:GyrI-like domain-containing protein n=1 Tax=Glaciibacter sp. 2TAF33 TaxID=3233015 RepID=UPI003F9175E4